MFDFDHSEFDDFQKDVDDALNEFCELANGKPLLKHFWFQMNGKRAALLCKVAKTMGFKCWISDWEEFNYIVDDSDADDCGMPRLFKVNPGNVAFCTVHNGKDWGEVWKEFEKQAKEKGLHGDI